MKTTVAEKRVIPTLQNMQQVYENYTEEDHLVWEILFNRQIKNLNEYASTAYLKGLEVIEFKNDRIPNFQRINQVLGDLTGWELVAVFQDKACKFPCKKACRHGAFDSGRD